MSGMATMSANLSGSVAEEVVRLTTKPVLPYRHS